MGAVLVHESRRLRVAAAAFVLTFCWFASRSESQAPPRPPATPPAPSPELSRLDAEARRAFDEGFYATAEAAAHDLLTKTEATYGPESSQTAAASNLLVRCVAFGASARAPESRRLAERAVELALRLYGDLDGRYAESLCNLAVLHERTGAAKEALPLFEKALAITERSMGANHPQVATVLNEYGEHFRTSGDAARALALFQRAVTILDATAHPDTLELSMILNRMAITYWTTGDYLAARQYYDRVLALREARYGPDHPRVTGILSNFAALLEDLGDSEAALEIFTRVLDNLRRKLDDPNDARIGVALLNVAVLTRPTDPERALTLYDSALATLRLRLGDHELVAKCLHGLGATHRDLGHVDAAIAGFDSALAVAARALPPGLWSSFVLRNLASLHFELGQVEKARDESERALRIAENSLGATHPEIAEILGVLGPVRLARGDTTTAIDNSLRAEDIATAQLRLVSRGFAEREALLYAASRPQGLDLPLALAHTMTAAQKQRAWDALVRSRAMVLDEMASRARDAVQSKDTETAHLMNEVRRTSTRLAGLIVAGSSDAPETHAKAVAAARQDKDAAERALAARSPHFRQDLDREQIGFAAVKTNLPAGSALVAFAEYAQPERIDPTVPRARRQPVSKQFLALVLDPHGQIHTIRIGARRDIEALVRAWIREAVHGPSGRDAPAAFDACMARGTALRRAVWDPIEPHLGDARLVFIVPEGALHRVNFAALPLASGRFLVETDRCIHTLTAERDLVTFATKVAPGAGMVVFGGADFDAALAPDARVASRAPVALPGGADETSRSASIPPCGGLAGVAFPPLPGTLREAKSVSATWTGAQRAVPTPGTARRVTVLTGKEASETALKSLAPGMQILHLATHGFVLGSDCPVTTAGTRGIHPRAPVAAAANPLLLSGLALAGANHRDTAQPDHDDGILTAEEVATLDLQGVEWAVLSGCDTGVGEVQTGEGVLGLRRAFQVAGARSLVMSLWAVSDAAACAWMEALYTARLREGLDTAAAVHAATKSILEARRRAGQSTHPFYWAGFVAAGDWK